MKRLLIKYSSEIALKKQNRRTFEDILVKNIRNRNRKNGRYSCKSA